MVTSTTSTSITPPTNITTSSSDNTATVSIVSSSGCSSSSSGDSPNTSTATPPTLVFKPLRVREVNPYYKSPLTAKEDFCANFRIECNHKLSVHAGSDVANMADFEDEDSEGEQYKPDVDCEITCQTCNGTHSYLE